jgi:TonB-dependent starch-binding outer membrane protein SusC
MKKNMNLKNLCLIFSMLLLTSAAFAQSTVKGKVTDASNGEGLIDATVLAKGSKVGAVTDIDGMYSITVPAGATELDFSYVGFTTVTVKLGASNVIDVKLSAGKALEEVVVVGYGTQKSKDVTGAITSISSANFQKGPLVTPEQLVSGKIAGVNITSNGGAPGGGSRIRIRGGASLNASNDPLFVIDGVPVDNGGIAGAANPLSFINPNDIESITVLKDASAAAIYGSRAANGVIIIQTKTGASGKLKFNFNTQLTLGVPTATISNLSGTEFGALVRARDTTHAKLLGKENTDWSKSVYQNTISTDNNFSVSGKAGFLPFRVSLGYLNQNGVLKGGQMNRFSGGLNLTPSFLDNHLKVNLNYKLVKIAQSFADEGAIGGAAGFDPTQKVLSGKSDVFGGYWEWLGKDGKPLTLAPRNPLSLLEQKKDLSDVVRHIGNIQLDYKFHFLPALRANVNIGFDKSDATGKKDNTTIPAFSFLNGGYHGEYDQAKLNKTFESYLAFAKDIRGNSLNLLAGYAYQDFTRSAHGFNQDLFAVNNIVDPAKVVTIRNALDSTQNTLVSFFGRANYNIKDKYLVTATLRRDGSSRFAPENRWGMFPSAAIAWKVMNEDFMKGSKLFSDLKFRLGWGVTGQQDIGSDYPYLTRYTVGQNTAQYQLGNEFVTTLRPEGYDRNIRWESTTTTNVAVDFGFMKSRVYGSIDVYNKDTKDLLSVVSVPIGSNFTNKILTNVGNMNNKGVEFSINTIAIQKDNASLNLGFNITYNKNEITNLSLPGTNDTKSVGIATGGISGGVGNNIQVHSVGYARNTFYVYQQVYGSDGKPVEGVYVDQNKDGIINASDLYRYKPSDPNIYLGFNVQGTYKALSAGCAMRATFNNYVYNNITSGYGNYSAYYNSQGFLSNLSSNVLETKFEKPQLFSDYYIENASFLRMDNIFVAYQLNDLFKSKTGLRVSANVSNVFTVSKYSGLDPEIAGGIDNNIYPRPRTYTLGLSLDF